MTPTGGKTKKKKFFGARFTSTISISLVLFVIGLIFLSGILAVQLSSLFKEQFTVTVVLRDSVKDAEIPALVKRFENTKETKKVTFISKEEALKTLEAELGEAPDEFLGYNPLYSSLELQLNADYACNDSIEPLKNAIMSKEEQLVDHIEYDAGLIDMVNTNLRHISIILAVLAVILLVICISLINNTIRLMLNAERFIINTMRLVGATAWFIRKPYILRGIGQGLLASFIALAAIGASIYYFALQDPIWWSIGQTVLQPLNVAILAGGVTVVGIMIPICAIWVSTSKYIYMSTDDLYLQ